MPVPSAISKAQATGTGCVISIGGPTGGTDTFVAIGEILTAKLAGAKRGVVTTTSFDSNGVASKLGTVLDSGNATLTTTRVSSDLGQLAVIAAFNAQPSVPYDFKIVLPLAPGQLATGDTVTFSAVVSAAGDFDMDISKQSENSFTLDISGPKGFTAGA
jgi:hypothetical protein